MKIRIKIIKIMLIIIITIDSIVNIYKYFTKVGIFIFTEFFASFML